MSFWGGILVCLFQLTTSRRGRPFYHAVIGNICNISTHDLTKRSTPGCQHMQRYVHRNFNSRPHEEVDASLSLCVRLQNHFNSRPHEEVDSSLILFPQYIHHFNSRPHEEVDSNGVLQTIQNLYFNSRPHEEVDPDMQITRSWE